VHHTDIMAMCCRQGRSHQVRFGGDDENFFLHVPPISAFWGGDLMTYHCRGEVAPLIPFLHFHEIVIYYKAFTSYVNFS